MLILWLQRHPRLIDWALLLAALATTVGAAAHHSQPGIGIPLSVVASLPLLVRRRYPIPVLAVTTAALVVQVAAIGLFAPLPAGIALFTAADQLERRESLLAGAATLVAITPALWANAGWVHVLNVVGRLVPFAIAWLLGDSFGTRRRYVAALEERAERLEREREAEAARAVAEEQARIARELHDVIAHTLSVIGEPVSFAPPPRLADLDQLLDELRASGLPVRLTIEGSPAALPEAVDLSAYRVVQEALTNTLKHAQATRAEVALRWGKDALEVEIRDDGVGATSSNGTGHGLVGM